MLDPNTVLRGFSRALYSNWLLYKPDRILIDCGEGCATALDGSVGSVEKLFLTHSHIDHVGGLPTLLWTRSAGGQKAKPLQIFHSADDPFLAPLQAYVEGVRGLLSFPIEWCPLEPFERVELKSGWFLDTFPTKHLSNGQSLGFRVWERRTRLKEEFIGRPQSELDALAARGEIGAAKEAFDVMRAAFCGDSLPVEADLVRGAEILVHEATIFEGEESGPNHSTLGDALRVGSEAAPKLLLLNHLSRHHSKIQIETAIREHAQTLNISGAVWILIGDEMTQVL
jgi:ribonuclease Z